jgi:hypothetical protein
VSVPSASSPNFANLGAGTDLFLDSNAFALKVAPCCFILQNWGDTPIGRTGRCIIRNEWPVIPCLLLRKDAGFFVLKTFTSPSTTAPKNELTSPSRAGSSMAEKLLQITCMRRRNFLARTESKRTLQRLGALQEDAMTMPYGKNLRKVTIQPFRVWHPPRMKTGLRNRTIGRKIAIK